MEIGKEVGRQLGDIRRKRGLCQIEVAAMAGYSQVYISLIECGKASPSLKALSAIADVLHARLVVSVEEVLWVGEEVE